MKIFTKQEKSIILVLSSLLVVGIIGLIAKKYMFDGNSDNLRLVGISEEISKIYSNIEKDSNEEYSININTADEIEMVDLPGVGPVLAKRIIEKRKEMGGFKDLDDLLKVSGIGPKKFRKILPYITFE
ncbi:MAG: helix-hairpin-helix domain-containing protein [Candidatus Marinimicrobia bacterium]|nr:helix-hairpin-helix domain-containing protein [Candidatus Neomarinimicrobiota bacterium]MBL7022655.1 helix-hairpin-helix domain-containing protein [Candidatus Neomarinimicrobiota bacterium]MBL7109921.1 helix-hairpin-helix domain-containing protein [Candidatus Neomarinimicrobiota bacterium]